jgi:hypothetical protein
MLVAISLTALCVLGIAFYTRFVYALCKECADRRICYLVCLRTSHPQHAISHERALDTSIPRAD